MGLFTSKKIEKEEWNDFCLNIANKLDDLMKKEHELIVKLIKKYNTNDKLEEKINIVNEKIGGEGEHALKAYYLFHIIEIMASKQYIDPDNGGDFMDLLIEKVCGENIENCMRHLSYYMEVKEERSQVLARACGRFMGYITGKENSIEFMFIVKDFAYFSLLVDLIIAETFGDKKGMKKVGEGLDKFYEK